MHCLEQQCDHIEEEAIRQLVVIIDDVKLVLTKVVSLLKEHHKYHEYVAQSVGRLNKLQGTQLPTFVKDNGEDKTEEEWKDEVEKIFYLM